MHAGHNCYHFNSDGLASLSPCLTEYSRRHLTKPSDVIKGLEGLLWAYAGGPDAHACGRPAVYHHCGVLVPNICQKHSGLTDEDSCFIYGLTWIPVGPTERRHGFPSWSWAGWVGEVEYSDSNWSMEESQSPLAKA